MNENLRVKNPKRTHQITKTLPGSNYGLHAVFYNWKGYQYLWVLFSHHKLELKDFREARKKLISVDRKNRIINN